MIGLGIRRQDGETWLEAALRIAAKYGMAREVKEEYDELRQRGVSEEEAAWAACYEWDVAELLEDDDE